MNIMSIVHCGHWGYCGIVHIVGIMSIAGVWVYVGNVENVHVAHSPLYSHSERSTQHPSIVILSAAKNLSLPCHNLHRRFFATLRMTKKTDSRFWQSVHSIQPTHNRLLIFYETATTSFTSGTSSFRILSIPCFRVLAAPIHPEQAPFKRTLTNPSGATSTNSTSPPSLWRNGRTLLIASCTLSFTLSTPLSYYNISISALSQELSISTNSFYIFSPQLAITTIVQLEQ